MNTKRLFNFIKSIFEKYFIICVGFLCLLIIIAIFDKILAVGIIFLFVLVCLIFWIINKLGLNNKRLTTLLLIALAIHLIAVLFIYYADFQPFGGGSGGYDNVHIIATSISENLKQGNFSFDGVPSYERGKYPYNYFSVVIGVIYAITMPEMIIGQLFQVWLVMLAISLVYLIVKEIGGSNKSAFIIGLIVSVYPSYLFYGSLLLKDALVTTLLLLGLLFCLKLIKKFSWKNFAIFYITLAVILNFRFYIGYALLFTFILSLIFFSNLNLKRKIIYLIIIVPLLGFLPEVLLNHGFFGVNVFTNKFSSEKITSHLTYISGFDSSWERNGDYLKSFIYVFLGPFPWQMKYSRHLFALFETIPWYLLLFFIFKGIWRSIKLRNKLVITLVFFSFLTMLTMSIFLNNFGIVTRVRIPAFIALLCLIPLGFKKLKTSSANFHFKFKD